MHHLKTAYQLGALRAHADFQKLAAGEVATPLAALLGPVPAGITGGLTAEPGYGEAAGLGAGAGSAVGGIGGALGGMALGGLGGYGLGKLLDKDPRMTGAAGMSLGTLLGMMGGSAAGAHIGRKRGIEGEKARRESMREMLKKELAERKED